MITKLTKLKLIRQLSDIEIPGNHGTKRQTSRERLCKCEHVPSSLGSGRLQLSTLMLSSYFLYNLICKILSAFAYVISVAPLHYSGNVG